MTGNNANSTEKKRGHVLEPSTTQRISGPRAREIGPMELVRKGPVSVGKMLDPTEHLSLPVPPLMCLELFED